MGQLWISMEIKLVHGVYKVKKEKISMSYITENTLVFRTKDVDECCKALLYQHEKYGSLNGTNSVFRNENITIITFDCNGQPLGVEEKFNPLVLETNYLDGDALYTQVYDEEKKCMADSNRDAKYWIRKLIGEENSNSIMNKLRYSDGR